MPRRIAPLSALLLCAALGYGQAAIAQLAVSPSGLPTVRIPIAVPPGMASLTPRLALVYTGDSTPGPLGIGWKLEGHSVITRCSPIKAIDGKSAAVSYTNTDKLCLDGQRLVLTGSTGTPLPVASQLYDAGGVVGGGSKEFRTQLDSFSRILSYGGENGNADYGPAYLTVQTKDGVTMKYGTPTIDAQGTSVGAVWPLASITDGSFFGDYINFVYKTRDLAWGSGSGTPQAGREWNLSEIDYAGNSLSAASNKVVFEYEDRPDNPGGAQDRSEAYNKTSKNVSIQRLKAIHTYINASGTLVAAKVYRFAYDTSPTTGRSRLINMKECAGDSTTSCLPATAFGYTAGGNESYAASSGFAGSPVATTPLLNAAKTVGVLLGDFNGDGKTDIVRWSSTPSQNQLWISNGNGGFSAASNTGLTSDILSASNGCYSSVVTDVNGDGLPDIIRYSGPVAPSGASCSSYSTPLIFINNGNNTFARKTLTSPALPLAGGSSWKNFLFFDVNGDGKVDIVTAVPPQTGVLTSPCPDGYTCAAMYQGKGDGTFTPVAQTATNLQKTPLSIPPIAGMPAGSGYVADIDGDGQLDVVSSYSFIGSFFGFTSQANGYFTATSTPACPVTLDANGDGRIDCLDPTAGTLQIGRGTTAVQTSTYNIPSSKTSGTGQGVYVLDANRDGRYDLLRWTNAPSASNPNVLYLSNGDGSFRQSSSFGPTLGTTKLKSSDGSADFVVGDFTGHGVPELLAMNTSGANALYVKSDSSPPDLLSTATTPTALKTTLLYEPLSNSAHYTSGRVGNGAVILPKEDITPPLYVVVSSQSDTGVGSSTVTRTYNYKGLRASMDGHGLLGFQEISEQTKAPDGSDQVVMTDYLQDPPYVGMVAQRQTYLGTLGQLGQRLGRVTNSYCDTTSSVAAMGIDTQNPAPPTPCATGALVNRPYTYQSYAEAWDVHGNALTSQQATSTFDAYGDETSKTVKATGQSAAGGTDTFTETTTSEYCPPETDGMSSPPLCPSGAPNPNNIQSLHWVIGHPTKVAVTRTVPDVLPSSDGSSLWNNGNGNGGTSTISPAVLNVILSLLLDD